MAKTHIDGPICPGCETKLKDAHPIISEWFREHVKPKHLDCHISCSFRGEKDQNEAKALGKSQLAWPLSAHNKSDDQGNPCAIALDLFELASNGMAVWRYKYFREIAQECEGLDISIRWGGTFKSLGDYCHFELEKTS